MSGPDARDSGSSRVPDCPVLTDAYELTPLQLAMLSHALSTPGSLAYCNQFEAELHGDVDSTRLQQAWHALVQRHHILRTSFHWRDLDTPLQAVRPEASVPWRTLDWTDRPASQQERDWAALVAEDRAQSFDYERAPLMRVLLVRRSTNCWSLCWTHHHLLLDGSCLRPLLQELLVLYRHPERPLPAPPQFGEYVRWRRQRGQRASEPYWRATLAGVTAATPLPWREGTEGLEPQWADQTCHGTLDAAATAALLAWCRRQRCTVAAALEAAWAFVLSRYSGEEDVVFGQTLAGRPATLPHADEILGPFINTVPVRHAVTPTTTVAELVRHAHRAQGGREAHGHEALADVHRWSDVAAGTPLFHSVFLVQNYRAEAPSPDADVGFTITPGALFDRTDVPLTVQFTPGPCLEIECAFDARRLDPALVARLPGHLTQVLAAFVRDDETPLGAIDFLTTAEHDQLDRFNETDAPIDVNTTLLPAIARWCRTTPEAIALRHGATALSYEALDQRVDRLAHTLRQRVPTIGRDQLVAVLAPRSYHMPLAILAAWRCGAAYVPIEPSYPADRIRSILEEARPAAVFVQPGTLDPALEAALRAQYCLLDLTQHDPALESPETPDPRGASHEPPRGADLAYVIFTSGSTGRPKGAMVEHTGLWNHLISKLETLQLEPTDRIAQNASHAFDISVWQFFAGLCAGATVVIYDEGTVLDAGGFLPRLHADRISVLEVVPSYLSVLLDQDEVVPLPSLRWMLVTGEVVKPPLLAQWFARYPAVPAVNAYGPSEAADDITLHVMRAPPSGGTVPIGRAIRNFRIYICTPNGTRCPVGIPGELWVSGPGVGRGYLGDDARTSAAFGIDPFRPGNVRLYRTGDLACYADDGSLLFIGRRDYQVKIRGHRIELGDVEAAMARLEGVRDIVVVDRRDPRGAWLAAYVTPHEGATLEPDVLLRQTAQLLPAYMVPTSCTLLEALPLSPNGKVDRKRLPFVEPSAHVAPSRAPRSPREQQLVAIWEEVLRHTPIGIDDNFFALGGDSLLAMQIVSRAARAGMTLTPRLLFTAQTIAELADAVGSVASGPSGELHPPQLGPAQYEFLSSVTVDPHHHAQSVLLESEVPLHPEAVRAALAAVVVRHESLRTRFARTGDEWRVAVTDAPDFLWRTVDVPAPAAPDAVRWPCDEAATSLMSAFDLTSGPLFGALHCRRADGAEALLLAAHHLVVDGMSWRTLLHDFFEAHAGDGYATRPDNRSRLAPPPPTYAEWASRQPVAGPAPTPAAGLVQDERHVVTLLDRDVGRQLAHEAHRVWRTDPTDLLVTAAVTAFATWSGTEQVAVSVESHGRGDDGRFAETVGWFTRTDRFTAASGAPPAGDPDEWARRIARAMDSRAQAAHATGRGPAATLQVNYHGQIEHVLPGPWRFRPDAPGADRSPRQPRLTPFELTAQTTARGFELHLQFDSQAHDAERMAALVRAIGDALTALLEVVCTLPPHLTWAEVPDAHLGTDELLTLHAQGVQPAAVDDVYLLSPTQQGMLFHSVEDPSTAMYVNQLTAVLDGSLDVEAFTVAWHTVAQRHPALRTTFHWDGLPHPVQVVHREATIPLAFEDWREQSTSWREEAWRLWCEEDRARGFDLTRPPLQRLLVARVGHTSFRVCWTQHHLLLDGWSAAVVLEEVLQVYQGTTPLAPPPPPFRQAVSWLAAQDRAQHRAYWQGRLADWTLRTPLPVGRAVLEGHTGRFEARELEHTLDAEATRSLQRCLLDERLTLSTVMQGVWALALARMTGETDVLFGAVVSGRPTALDGADAMIGVFINTIPVRVAVPDESSVSEWLRALQLQQAESEPFQYGSLAHIQQLSGAGTGAPLFDTLLNVANYRIGDALQNTDAGLAIRHVHAWEPNNYPLTLVVTPGETLTLTLLYDAGRFDARTADALLHRVVHLIVRLSSAPGAAVGTVSLLTAGEQQALLAATTATPQPMPPHETVWQAIATHARSAPDRLAVYSTSARLSYRMLVAAVEERATVLRARGAQRNSRILVEQSRDAQLLVTMLACWRIGAVYVPMDPAWPAARRTLVTERVRAAVHMRNDTLDLPIGSTTAPAREASFGDPDDGPRRDALAYIIHTSGSTGVPKGAMLAHDGLLNHVTSMIEELALDHTSVVAQTASQGFDISLWQLCAALVAGGTTAIFEDPLVLDPPALLAAMRGAGVTVMQCVPSYLRLLVDQPELPQLDRLRWLVSIGEALPARLVERWFEACPHVPLMNAYGPTEASDSVTHHVFNGPPSSPVVPLGHPIRNMGYFLVDPAGRLCPPGVIGEIVLAGIGVGRGYLFDDERTLAAFADDPFVPARRIYRTGDLGLIDFDGRLCFAGRRDGQVKIRGHRLEIGEIEAALDRVPGVQEAVVLAQRDADPGAHDATVLEAFVVPVAGVSWTLEALTTALRPQLSRAAMPARLRVMPSLPKLASGKVDRRALADLARTTERVSVEVSDAASTPLEALVQQVWQTVLGHAPGLDENFFAAGGHSLHALQLAGALAKASGVRLDVGDIFALPTIRGQAALLAHGGAGDIDRVIDRLPDAVDYPVTPAQQRLWLASRTSEGARALHMHARFRIHGPLQLEALTRAVARLLDRHESLRTTFMVRAGTLRQRVAPYGAVDEVLTIYPHAPAALDESRDGAAPGALGAPLPLDRGPLLRLHLWPESSGGHGLHIVLHHVIGDAQSVQVLMRDLVHAYRAMCVNDEPDWEPLEVQARDAAAWLAGRAAATHAADEAYWLRILHPRPTPLPLMRRAARSEQAQPVARRTVTVDAAVVSRLHQTARAQHTTLFALLGTAVAVALHEHTGSQDMVLGTQRSLRQHPALHGQIGLLIDSIPLRMAVTPHDTAIELVQRMSRVVRDAVTHGSIGYDRMIDLAPSGGAPSAAPLIDAVVQYVTNGAPVPEAEATTLQIEDVTPPVTALPYPLVVEATDGIDGSLQIECSVDGTVDPALLETLASQLPHLLEWLIAPETSPLASRPNAVPARSTRPARPRISLDLT